MQVTQLRQIKKTVPAKHLSMKNAICWRHIHLQSFFPAHFSLIRAVSCVQVGWPHLPDAIRGYGTCRVHITSPHLDVTYRSVAVCCQRCNRGYLCKHEARQTNVNPQHYKHDVRSDHTKRRPEQMIRHRRLHIRAF